MNDVQLCKKLDFKQVRIGFPEYDYTLDVVMGDFSKLNEYVKWKFDDADVIITQSKKLGYTIVREGYCPIMWLPRTPKTPKEISTLAHEASHVAMHLYDHIGTKWIYETEEFGAYTIGYIVNEVLSH